MPRYLIRGTMQTMYGPRTVYFASNRRWRKTGAQLFTERAARKAYEKLPLVDRYSMRPEVVPLRPDTSASTSSASTS